tara:strand:+ start:558 stop:863 length:306 start_codon:yes stop_codon:yes gene_type:complete
MPNATAVRKTAELCVMLDEAKFQVDCWIADFMSQDDEDDDGQLAKHEMQEKAYQIEELVEKLQKSLDPSYFDKESSTACLRLRNIMHATFEIHDYPGSTTR